MPTVSVSFHQRERDFVDAGRYDHRHGPLRRFMLLTPPAFSVFFLAVFFSAFGGWPGLLWVLVSIGMGVLLFLNNWYLAPYMMSNWITDVGELNGTLADRVVVSLSEDGVLWSAADRETSIPWSHVKNIESLDSAVCIRAGRPLTTLWIPGRAFASPAAIESFARIAQLYSTQVEPAAHEQMSWPQTPQQRRAGIMFAIVYGGNFLLTMLLLWWVRG